MQNTLVKKELSKIGKFFFIPNKGNWGDIIIAASEYQFLDNCKFEYKVTDTFESSDFEEPFNLVYGGGGIWNKYYKDIYEDVLEILKSKNLQKCIILPSSFYECDEVVESFDEKFVVFCREKQSYEYCTSLNNRAKFLLSDDMAINSNFEDFRKSFFDLSNIKNFLKELDFSKYKQLKHKVWKLYRKTLKKSLPIIRNKKSNVGYFLREDIERALEDNKFQNSIDLSSLSSGYCCDKGLVFILSKLFLEIIDNFNIIVTDRLHVGICATKLGKKVYLIDNSYKKVSSVYNFSLKHRANVELMEAGKLDIEEIKQKNGKISNYIPRNFLSFLLEYMSIKNDYGCEKHFW